MCQVYNIITYHIIGIDNKTNIYDCRYLFSEPMKYILFWIASNPG